MELPPGGILVFLTGKKELITFATNKKIEFNDTIVIRRQYLFSLFTVTIP
jgi:hypothetical protein